MIGFTGTNASEFIKAHTIRENDIFTTGLYYKGITIYNQQIRTLNLVYGLHKKNLLKTKSKRSNEYVIVIGGGISGVSTAYALIKLGYKVCLLERKSILLHLQHGSVTRSIHPNLYDWPSENSMKPYTELPFLNWEATNAANIEKKIIEDFLVLQKESGQKLQVFFSVNKIEEEEQLIWLTDKYVKFNYRNPGSSELQRKINYSKIILATGFGLEQYVGRKEQTKSYWRNEDYSQLRLSDQVSKFFISGTGDGGIIDLCRLALIAYDPLEWAEYFNSLQYKSNDKKTIKERLLHIDNSKSRIEEFESIYSDFSEELSRKINKTKRHDISELVLNGKDDSIAEIIDKKESSFLNSWLLFLLYKNLVFKYHKGEFPNECGKFLFSHKDDGTYKVIVRHGTDKNFDEIEKLNRYIPRKLKSLKSLQEDSSTNEFSISPHWDLHDWVTDNMNYYQLSSKLTDISNTFTKIIEGLINKYINDPKKFRVTIHRLIKYRESYYFQQISSYGGRRRINSKEVGRIFPIHEGIVGLAMRTCNSISWRLNPKNITDLNNYEELCARPLQTNTSFLLALPVNSFDKNISTLCLYIDSEDQAILKNHDLLNTITNSLYGFVKHLENINVSQQLINNSLIDKIDISRDEEFLSWEKLDIINDKITDYLKDRNLKFSDNRIVEVFDNE